jgi:ABC-type lipoprotein export system ATPase subunit
MLLELSHITRFYQSAGPETRRTVLDDISLSVNEGDSIAITGPSGSGKSTLLNIMGTLDKPDSGSVKFMHEEINLLKESELASIRNKKIGFVFQMHYLLPQLNLLENVLLPIIAQSDKVAMQAAETRGMELLASVGLADKINRYPWQLSVGECQRAAVVRALINEPLLILADEPTGSLDHKSAQMLSELLCEINIKFSIALVLVTHSTEISNLMKIQYQIDNGKLIQK